MKSLDNFNTDLRIIKPDWIQDDLLIIDIHTHLFDRDCISLDFIKIKELTIEYNPFYTEIKQKINAIYDLIKGNNSKDQWNELKIEYEKAKYLEGLPDLGSVINIVLGFESMSQVQQVYTKHYGIFLYNRFQNYSLGNCVLMLDLETGWKTNIKKKFSTQVDELNELAKNEKILPFLSVDPRRADREDGEDLNTLFQKAFCEENSRFVGIKCYPSLGYLPIDDRLDDIFRISAENGIPVTSHCGGNTISTFEKSIDVVVNGKRQEFIIPGKTREERADYLNQPDMWEPVLKKYPKLKLNLAHFGTDSDWKEYKDNGANDRIQKILDLINNPNYQVYTDFSYNLIYPKLYDTLKSIIHNNPILKIRLMFGTDFWVSCATTRIDSLLESEVKFTDSFYQEYPQFFKENQLRFLFSSK